MKHVSDQLGRWQGGELDAAAAAAVEAHLEACPDCRREADALRTVWSALDAARPEPAPASVWPGVQARTFGARRGWFFAGRPALQTGLAAAAILGGLLVGVILPAGGEATAATNGESTLWSDSSRVLDDAAEGSLALWLAPGDTDAGTAGTGTEATR